jgi:hypothetical protein
VEITWPNCFELAYGGRRRWKIENEGFNAQTNGGYGLEHVWSDDLQAQQNFYRLRQIAHRLNQWVEKASLLVEAFQGRVLSLKATTRDRLAEIKRQVLPWEQWHTDSCRGFQIRLDSG